VRQLNGVPTSARRLDGRITPFMLCLEWPPPKVGETRLKLDPVSSAASGKSLQDLIELIGSGHVERRFKIEVEHEA
jgi:hypothetical protein